MGFFMLGNMHVLRMQNSDWIHSFIYFILLEGQHLDSRGQLATM